MSKKLKKLTEAEYWKIIQRFYNSQHKSGTKKSLDYKDEKYSTKSGDPRKESIMKVAKKFDINLSTFKRINSLNGRVTFRRNSTVLIPKSSELKSKYTLKGTGDFNYTSVGTHHVSKGDTLGGIARKYKVSIEDLKEFNELDSHIIIIGTTIDIPQ